MSYNIMKKQVREINRKIFAYDIIYNEDLVNNVDNKVFVEVISTIIQGFDSSGSLSNIPQILEIKDDNISEGTIDKIKLLSKQSVYLQFNNRVLADSYCLNVIKELRESGYKIIIEVNKNDSMFKMANLLASIIKFNIRDVHNMMHSGKMEFTCRTLAYNVDTPYDYTLAESVGVSLYEGDFVGESFNFKVQSAQHSEVGFADLLGIITDVNADVNKVISIIEHDSLLVAQILRLANSKYFNTKGESVKSIKNAIARIGIAKLRQWIFLLEFGRNDNPREDILEEAYYRALFCEAIALETKGAYIRPSEAYLVGLLSNIDILTGRNITTELASLNLTRMIEDSLIYRDNAGGAILNLILAFEESNEIRMNWYCGVLKIEKETVSRIYGESIMKARDTWRSMTTYGGVYL